MTIAVNDAVDEFIAVGGETQFSYTFPIIIPIPPTLHPITVENRLSGVLTTLVEGVDFSVTGAGNPLGGDIVLDTGVFPSGAIAGVTWTIERNNPIDRLVDFQTAGDFFAFEVNDDMDYITQILQDQKRDIDTNFANSIHLKDSSLATIIGMDDPIVGSFLRAKGDTGFDWALQVSVGSAIGYDDTSTNSTKDKLVDDLRMNDLSQLQQGFLKLEGDRTIQNSFLHREIFRINLTAFTTLLTLTPSGTPSGLVIYAKVIINGHTSGIGDGILVSEWRLEEGGAFTEIRRLEDGLVAGLRFQEASEVITLQVESNDGVAQLRGIVEVELHIPRDFGAGDGTTWTIT